MSTYSIPIAKAAAIADDIAAGRQSEQTRIGPGAWLGVSLGTRNVAVLTAVYPNSPAAAARLLVRHHQFRRPADQPPPADF